MSSERLRRLSRRPWLSVRPRHSASLRSERAAPSDPIGGMALHASPLTAHLLLVFCALALAACSSAPTRDETASRKPGGYYLDDGPLPNPPKELDKVADAQPKLEPVKASTARPYAVMGHTYTPMTQVGPYKAIGIASWYGKRYHGQATSSGEIYDMYGMTAAHTTLPIPSYVRVTSLKTNRSVIVRVNDRGPFHADRLIDLSYTAAYKLGILTYGSSLVEVESIVPGEATTAVAVAKADSPVVTARPKPNAASEGLSAARPQEPDIVSARQVATDGQAVVNGQAAPAPLLTQEPPGVYVQLGAFSLVENARSFLTRLQAELNWLSETAGIYQRAGVYRVQAGPYSDRSEAMRVASRIEQALELKPVLISR